MPVPAPTCLLLHGFTGSAADWAPWTAHDPRLLAIDLPGHGAAPAPPVQAWHDTIQTLLATLPDSIERVVGYSLGGRIALGLITAAPERFRAATLISTHPGLCGRAARPARQLSDRRWIERLRTEGIAGFVAAWESQPLFATQRRLPSVLLERQRLRRLRQDPAGLAQSLACHGLAEMPDAWAALTRFPGRLRWILGGEDARFVELGRRVALRRTDLDLRILPGIGHNPLLEAPDLLTPLLGDPDDVPRPPAADSALILNDDSTLPHATQQQHPSSAASTA